jgi:antitoxin component of RelBE/YafQ-DinJ toxin-antitoxin module
MIMNTTTLHIPIDKTVRSKLEAKAKRLGFDSAQAYIRVWAKAEAENRILSFDDDEWGEPSVAAVKRLTKASEDAKQNKNVSEPFYDTKTALEHLHDL